MNGIRQSPLLSAQRSRGWQLSPAVSHVAATRFNEEANHHHTGHTGQPSKPRSIRQSTAFEVYSDATVSKSQLRKASKRAKSVPPSESTIQSKIGIVGVLTQTWMISWMFIFMPLGFAAYNLGFSPVVVFVTNFLAIVPQAWIMGKATEDLAASSGSIIGGLLNAWFGNIVEMLLCIAGIRQGELVVVRCTLVGSILSNLLLVTGCALFFGGLKYRIQQFSAIGASTSTSLLLLGTFCASLPTLYVSLLSSATVEALHMSRIVSFFLIFIYLQFMLFQLGTHSWLYNDDADDDGDMTAGAAALILGLCTVTCTFNSEYLISSIEGVVSSWDVSKEFLGIILLPIIGNAAEHYTSVLVALNNKMDLSLGCAVGSSCQMLLFVTPVTVLIGWIVGQPMTLDLHTFEIMILLICVIIISGILQDGYSNWLEGSILLTAYVVIGLVYFYEDPKFSDII
eukprot:Protomagalhaensia_wolfi_Nauph_80__1121@NODE_165_length_3359_cov_142_432831_g124_i0_p1_GENE_NODE_165_length_3359_cov_142_432831_g124_i0NODE_165_length_3359_cov_142_432831_g124_i0_p1_ORF_typecomplete_len454_score42_49Na_Ca_ex/PF01699_24/7_6e23Na_Ca_ex/PF01699_24/1_5e20_NODE_165_length_3359_cov_142_432831_g124_i017373098